MEVQDISIRAKEEYKQTEVGSIPADWEILPIEELFTFLGGSQPPRDTFIFQEKKGYVRLLQIRDYKNDKYASYIPEHLAKRSCTIDDIMIGRYGPPIFQILNGLDGAYNVALIKATPTSAITFKYGWFILKQQKLFDFVDKLSQRSSGQTGVDLNELKKYLVPLPPTKAEQTAIATVLSDTDALINRLETLIEKKRAIKQGATQQLLKPKEGWVAKKLGEVLRVRQGKSQKEVIDESGTFPILASGGIIGKAHTFLYNKPSVLIGRKGTIDVPQYWDRPFWSVDTLFYTEIFEGYYAKFIFYLFSLIDWYSFNEASGVPSLNAKTIEQIERHFPKTKEEQTRIAQILSDMDAEIANLEQKLAKYKLVKQGMMQELLTGKTRLV